jgi:hypothetical protein
MVATRQASPGNLPSTYVFILHSDDRNFFLLISSGLVYVKIEDTDPV